MYNKLYVIHYLGHPPSVEPGQGVRGVVLGHDGLHDCPVHRDHLPMVSEDGGGQEYSGCAGY